MNSPQEASLMMMETQANEYPDIRLDAHDLAKSVVFQVPNRMPKRPQRDLAPLLKALAIEVRKKAPHYKRHSFSVSIGKRIKYRVQHIRDTIFSLRLCMAECIPVDELGIQKPYVDMLMNPDLKHSGGLVVVSGLPGCGKTTTLAATISGRLKAFGGFAVSIEDPIEMPLEGFHGENGYCEQMQVEPGESFYNRIVDSLRCFPSGDTSMLALGEVRENDAASELLRIGIDGHLVFTTVHAKDPVAAIHRILTMASQDGEASARQLLANALKLVVHQRMVNNKPQLTALNVNEKVKATLLDGNIEALREEVRITEAQIRHGATVKSSYLR